MMLDDEDELIALLDRATCSKPTLKCIHEKSEAVRNTIESLSWFSTRLSASGSCHHCCVISELSDDEDDDNVDGSDN